MRRTIIALAAVAFLVMCGAAPHTMNADSADADMIIAFTGSLQGYLEDCGCPGSPQGGLARRAAYINRLKNSRSLPILHLDAGGFSKRSRDAEVRVRTIMQTYGIMDVRAVNVAATDLLSLGPALLEIGKESGVSLISANIYPLGGKAPIFRPSVTVEIGGHRVGIIGITDVPLQPLRFADGSEYEVRDPVKAVAAEVAKMEGKTDLIVLLAYMQFAAVRNRVPQFKGVDIILGADGFTTSWSDVVVENVPVAYAGRQGQKLVLLDVNLNGSKPAGVAQTLVQLKTSLPEDGRIKEIVDSAKQKLTRIENEQRDDVFALDGLRAQVNKDYVGFGACRECHSAEYEIWRKSTHYKAFDPLIRQHRVRDQNCLPCHTTGYFDRGFVDVRVTPQMVHVQCEACHGTGTRHVADPTQSLPVVNPSTICTGCHDARNSPNFDFSTYWVKIEH